MPQLKVSLSIGFANARQEDIIDIDEEEWESSNEEERDKLIEQYASDWANNYISIGAVIAD